MSTHHSSSVKEETHLDLRPLEEVDPGLNRSSSASSSDSGVENRETPIQRQQLPIQTINHRQDFVREWEFILSNRLAIRCVYTYARCQSTSLAWITLMQLSSRIRDPPISCQMAQKNQHWKSQVAKACAKVHTVYSRKHFYCGNAESWAFSSCWMYYPFGCATLFQPTRSRPCLPSWAKYVPQFMNSIRYIPSMILTLNW